MLGREFAEQVLLGVGHVDGFNTGEMRTSRGLLQHWIFTRAEPVADERKALATAFTTRAKWTTRTTQ
jgi:hypothetical protein